MNPAIILAFLGANSISEMISALAYLYANEIPLFFGNTLNAIGFFVLLFIYVKRLEEKEKEESNSK